MSHANIHQPSFINISALNFNFEINEMERQKFKSEYGETKMSIN